MKKSEHKDYDPGKIEKKWQKEWAAKKVYKTESTSKKEKFYILDMFPYPSGEGLHVGHPKGYIATDVVSRMKRMQGFNVLHPMGFDAFGLPAENYAIKMKINPQIAVAKNIDRYKKQLELIGLDYDWSREVNTTDPKFYKWSQWIFLKLLEKGLAFESNEPVNWCPLDKTVLANEDVEDGRCERCGTLVEKKPMRQWVLRITDYADRLLEDLDLLDWPESIKESQRNWIGRSEGAEIGFKLKVTAGDTTGEVVETVKVFTTRPDTIFGATAIMISPEHPWLKTVLDQKSVVTNATQVREYIKKSGEKTEIERTDAKKEKTGVILEGVRAINPAHGGEIPVFIADYVLADYGTGAVMSVPAHDERDFAFAKKHGVEIKHVVIPRMVDESNPHVPGKELVFREVVMVVIKNPRTNEFLLLKWKKQPWTTFVMGGVEDGEDVVEAARREVEEETGYANLKFIRILGGPVQSEFFATHKNVNRIAHTQAIYFELENEERKSVTDEEAAIHDMVWVPMDELTKIGLTHVEAPLVLDRLINGDKPYTESGIIIKSGDFNRKNSEEIKQEITKAVGGTWVTKYKLRDWVFSRQRYWGEPIPVLHDTSSGVDVVIPVSEKDLPVTLPKVTSYEPTGTGESPLAAISKWVNVKIGKGKNAHTVRRETNTMPQWAGSSWYYLRYMDPNNSKALVDSKVEKYWNTVDLYVGGAEHATRHLIYARFWHKFLYDIGVVSTKEPFKRLQSVGLIMAQDGRKMSKRFGNVINPDDVIATYGADTLRLFEMFLGPFDQTAVWNTESIIGVRRFLEKVWRLQSKVVQKGALSQATETILHKTVQKVSEDIAQLRFNTSISALMILVNALEKEETIPRADFEMFIKVLAPFAPHITEELWSAVGNKKTVHKESWPVYNSAKLIEDEVTIGIQINGKTRAELKIALNSNEKEVVEAAYMLPDVLKWVESQGGMQAVKKVIYVKNRLLNIVINP